MPSSPSWHDEQVVANRELNNFRDEALSRPPPISTAMQAEDKPAEATIAQKMLAASAGSVLTSLLVTPLDVVRVRLQSQHHPSSSSFRAINAQSLPAQFSNLPSNLGISACCREVFWVGNNAQFCVAGPTVAPTTPSTACAVEETRARHFTSTFDGLAKIARNEGPRTLWRGLSPTLVMAVPANVIYFAGYDWLRVSPKSPLHGLSDHTAPLVAGSVARILAAAAVSPIEMFRTRMQAVHQSSTTGVFRDTMDGIVTMVRQEGVHSLWRGLTLTLWRDVPFSAIYWWGYESGRNLLTDVRGRSQARSDGSDFSRGSRSEHARRRSRSRSDQNHSATLIDSFVAGSASGAVAAFVTTPFDVGKTRQQVVRHSGNTGAASTTALRPEEQSMPRFLLHIFREQGLSGLFRGWAARCMKVAPACAIMISSYEVGKKMATGTPSSLDDD